MSTAQPATPPAPAVDAAGTAAAHAADRLLADERLTVLGLLFETLGGLASLATDQLAASALGGADFEVLMRLARSPDGSLRMTDLATQTMLSSSGVTRIVDRLAGCALVQRRACFSDRRATYAEITDLGRDRLLSALPGHLDLAQRAVIDPLDPADLEILVRALRRIRAEVRPGAEAGAATATNLAACDPQDGSAR